MSEGQYSTCTPNTGPTCCRPRINHPAAECGPPHAAGKALKGRRQGVVVATKWGPMFTEGGQLVMDGSPQNARRCVEGSLRRLQLDCIDLFTMRGAVDPKVPLEETMQELKVGLLLRWRCVCAECGCGGCVCGGEWVWV